MGLISIVTGCYNEEDNVEELYNQVKNVINTDLPNYDYEHIFIDNASTDRTVDILQGIASKDKRVKIIENVRNFGHIKSPFYGLLQAKGDVVIYIVADLQDPPEMIKKFVEKWEHGYKIVIGIKKTSEEKNKIILTLRNLYYSIIKKISDIEQIKNFTGFGLYDKEFINILKTIKDPYPYFRGLISDIGFERCEIDYRQPSRKKGKTKNSLYTLYDMAMLGFVNHSKYPLRLASFLGFGVAILSLIMSLVFFLYKIIYWERFDFGMAPLIISLFFFASVQLFFIGIVGEYVGAVYTQVRNRPLVIEKRRTNFD